MTIVEAGKALRARQISSAELLKRSLSKITALNDGLNAFLLVMEESARAEASRADAELASGRDRGPLHGIPVAVKDLFLTKGIRTTAGSKIFAGYIPDRDATVLTKLRAAGAVIVGKTHLHELAYGVTSNNPHFGPVRNPHDPNRIPGGSSGGSGAAVASGMVLMAMGTDTGGSIRIPASYCGTAGLKPTFGLVSKNGCMPLGLSLDHMGPLTNSVADAALCLNALAGYDPGDACSVKRLPVDYSVMDGSLQGVRVGWPENFFFDAVDEEVAAAVSAAADRARLAGAEVVPVKVPDVDALNVVARVILLAEAAAVMRPYLHRREDFGKDVLALLDSGQLLPATDYVNAQRVRRQMQADFRQLFQKIDVLLTPATPIPAPLIGETTVEVAGRQEDVRLASTRLVRGINALGLPALSVPCGVTQSGLPIGLQIVGRAFEEKVVLQVGHALSM
ncbi:MAG TPA: amidase [Bryobacteraceae bacterium]|nr:amidase [Bryobacteraceae bacterium]